MPWETAGAGAGAASAGPARPPACGGACAAAVGSRCYFYGGTDRELKSYGAGGELWQLETAGGSRVWSKPSVSLAPGLTLPNRTGASMCAVGLRLYVFGGADPETGTCFNDVAILDLNTWQWTRADVTGSPPPRNSHAACVLLGRLMLVFGGGTEGQGPLNDLLIFDTVAGSWSRAQPKGPAPAAREMHTLTALPDGRAILFGGRGADGEVLNDATVLRSDAAGGDMTWGAAEETAFARCSHSAAAWASSAGTTGAGVILYGGFSGSEVAGQTLWLDAATLDVRVMAEAWQGPLARFAHAACCPDAGGRSGRSMVVFGGVDPSQDLSDVAVWRDELPAAPALQIAPLD